MIVLQEITSNYGECNCFLVVRAFACRRTNRERQHSWLRLVWRQAKARTTGGNQNCRIDFVQLVLSEVTFANSEVKFKNMEVHNFTVHTSFLFHNCEVRLFGGNGDEEVRFCVINVHPTSNWL